MVRVVIAKDLLDSAGAERRLRMSTDFPLMLSVMRNVPVPGDIHVGSAGSQPGRHQAASPAMARSLAGCLMVAMAAGCGITDFDVDQPVPAQTIQGSGIPAPLAAIFPLPLNLDLESKIKAKDTGPIDSVTLSSLTLHITSSGGDWSFVTSIEVSVESTRAGTALPRKKIASVSSPGAVQTLTFDIERGVNLKPYIDEGSQVNSSGSGTQPTRDVSFDGKGVFTVHPL